MSSDTKALPVNILLTISFLEGAAVMIIELLGAKIIAPYYGTSLYVWSSVLGVTLGALALGYYLGGIISNKYPQNRSLFVILLVGAFFTIIAPLIAPAILTMTDSLGVRIGSLTSVLGYLLIPITCMGSISPIIIQHINKDSKSAGKSAGTVYAISTIGGITATFLAGFFLIPFLGIIKTAISTGLLLALISISYFLFTREKKVLLTALILAIISFVLFPSYTKNDQLRIVYNNAGVLGEWTVLDNGDLEEKGNGQIQRRLLLNGIDQTYIMLGVEPLSLWMYPHKIAAITSIKPEGSKALLLGMGGGSVAYEMSALGFDLDIVEIDHRLKEIAINYFGYDPLLSNLIIDDGRHYIRTTKEKYDIVVIDVLIGEVQPSHIFSMEGFQDLITILNEDAIVVLNFQGTLNDARYSVGPKSIYKTMKEAGFELAYYSNDKGLNNSEVIGKDIIFIGSVEKMDYKGLMLDLRYNGWIPNLHFKYEDLISGHELDCSNAKILIDDKPHLELLNSKAILEWRKIKIDQNIKAMLEKGVPIYK